jgi:predicted glycosyltransferase
MKAQPRTIWIDLENTPHVPLFEPIVSELEQVGCTVIVTARDFAQTVELANRGGIRARVVGKGGGSGSIRKTIAVLMRALRLAWILRKKKIELAVGHGSRGLLIAGRLLRVPVLTLYDYEGASVRIFNRWSTWVLTPDVISSDELAGLGLAKAKHLVYPGLKEEVYLQDLRPSSVLPVRLKLTPNEINVVVRPPSETAHYRSDRSRNLFDECMALLVSRSDLHVILLPRDPEQRRILGKAYGKYKNLTIPEKAVDAPSLLYYSDLVLGGGGTMNREAAVIGVPVLSIFKGPEGAVDRALKEQGRMTNIEKAEDILNYLHRRDRSLLSGSSKVRDSIVQTILRLSSYD